MIQATAHLVNGELQPLGPVHERTLAKLQREGYAGRELIHALITDDWGAPPRFVELEGTGEDGKPFFLRISYD